MSNIRIYVSKNKIIKFRPYEFKFKEPGLYRGFMENSPLNEYWIKTCEDELPVLLVEVKNGDKIEQNLLGVTQEMLESYNERYSVRPCDKICSIKVE